MNITSSKIIPWSFLHYSINCGEKDHFREEYANTDHFGSKSLTVNYSKAHRISTLSQYSQFSAAWIQIPNLRLEIYYSLLSMQLDSCMLAHSSMLATSSAIQWG